MSATIYPTRFAHTISWDGGPQVGTLEKLVDDVFFASLATEEGEYQRICVAYVKSIDELRAARFTDWDLLLFGEPRPLTVNELKKLAGATRFGESFLLVEGSGTLTISGLGTPRDTPLFSDGSLRLLSPAPGTLIAARGSHEVARYAFGQITRRPASPLHKGPHRRQIDAIQYSLLGDFTDRPVAMDDVPRLLERLLAKFADRAHGGLFAVLPPGTKTDEACVEASRLTPPIDLGGLLVEHAELGFESYVNFQGRMIPETGEERPPTEDEMVLDAKYARSERALALALDHTMGLMSLDGALLVSHRLEVLAFGAKLPLSEEKFDVYPVGPDGTKGEPSQQGSRGFGLDPLS